MDKIIIYYGPKSGFEELLKEEDVDSETYKKFLELTKLYDDSRRKFYHLQHDQEIPEPEPIEIENLVAFSDEYASVLEHAIINFDGIISNFTIKNIFLHNPPQVITKKLEIIFSEITKIIFYDYKKIDENTIRKIYFDFDDRIIGQSNVKLSLLRSLVPSINENYKKPIVILFYGPSGVGKTETAKFLSEIMGGKMFRKQFSMFQNEQYANYLFGGQHNEKCFSKEILEREANVLLLDEFDKAHHIFHSAFYQLFDEGIFEDKNYTVNIGNAIIICTSNYLSVDEIKKQLGEPIFSRFEACIGYDQLSSESIKSIIKNHIENEWTHLSDENKALINKESIESHFDNYLNKIKNVRIVESFVRQIIYNQILMKIISEKESK